MDQPIGGKTNAGTQVTVDAKQNVFQSKNKQHSIDATVSATKQLGGPQGTTKTDVTLGGQYNYNTDKVSSKQLYQTNLQLQI